MLDPKTKHGVPAKGQLTSRILFRRNNFLPLVVSLTPDCYEIFPVAPHPDLGKLKWKGGTRPSQERFSVQTLTSHALTYHTSFECVEQGQWTHKVSLKVDWGRKPGATKLVAAAKAPLLAREMNLS